MSDASPLYFRQLLVGRDLAVGDPVATQMVNFVYLIGDRHLGKCVVVDAAWDVQGLWDLAEQDGMQIDGVLATHHHPDHVGGDLFGRPVAGVRDLLEKAPIKVHCQKDEAEWIRRTTEISSGDMETYGSGDVLSVGEVDIRMIHTPGHTPGSQCFLVEGRLVAGDTLFLQGCGRTDFPGGDAEEMHRSLTQRLAKIPADTILYPGHLYDPRPSAPLGEVRETNPVFRARRGF